MIVEENSRATHILPSLDDSRSRFRDYRLRFGPGFTVHQLFVFDCICTRYCLVTVKITVFFRRLDIFVNN